MVKIMKTPKYNKTLPYRKGSLSIQASEAIHQCHPAKNVGPWQEFEVAFTDGDGNYGEIPAFKDLSFDGCVYPFVEQSRILMEIGMFDMDDLQNGRLRSE